MSIHRTFPKSVQPGIPKLSELKSGWNRCLVGQLFDEVKRPANIQDDQKYRLVTVKRARGGLAPRSELFGKQISVKSQFFIRTGDFLISKRQIVHGACAIVTDEFDGAIVSNEYSVLRCSDELQLDYLAQLFHSIYLQQTFFHSSIGVHIEKMIFKLGDWFKWPVNLPPLPEQQKIASFLSSVDRKIAQLGQKKALLQQYKKGMMQKLFSQELRFKDAQGNDFPDWEEKRLGDISTSFSGGTPSSSNRAYYSGDISFIGSGNIGATNVNQYITEKALKNSSAKMVKKGDILYALYGATSGEVAISKIDGAINQAILCIRSNEWLEYLYQHLLFKKGRILATFLQGGQGNLSALIIKALKIDLPSKPEQQKIADFLSSIDQKIDLVSTELAHAKAFKKGLLQQMFI